MAQDRNDIKPWEQQSHRFGTETKKPESTMEKAKQAGAGLVEKARETGTNVAEKAKDAGSSVIEKAKETASTVAQTGQEMASNVGRKAEDATKGLGSGMESLGQSLESGGRYLQDSGLQGIGDDLTALVRNNPIPAILIGVGIGFLMGRAFKMGS